MDWKVILDALHALHIDTAVVVMIATYLFLSGLLHAVKNGLWLFRMVVRGLRKQFIEVGEQARLLYYEIRRRERP